MNILVSGGSGYVGAWLVPQLLAEGHKVTVYDPMWFGTGFLPDNGSLTVVKADVREQDKWIDACKDQEAVIYMASISRELMCQQNPDLAFSVNIEPFRQNVLAAKECGVKRFIYASSVAVYGSSDHDAKESDMPRAETIRQYMYANGKIACEKVLWDFGDDDFCWTVTRSASACGYSTHQRLDITVNRMVHDACRRGVITVEGGKQKRSHIHIQDLCEFYKLLLVTNQSLIAEQVFNVVAVNQAVVDSALMVQKIVETAKIEVMANVDDRSYSVDGAKAKEVLGYVPSRTIEQAVRELKVRFDAGYWPDSLTNPIFQNMADGLS